MKVICYHFPESRRSTIVARAMHAGISRCGETVDVRNTHAYQGTPEADIAVFYGLSKPVLRDYSRPGHKAVFVDLGYWAREGQEGCHKVTVNSRHPTEYFQKRYHKPDRFDRLGIKIKPWRKSSGRSIMVVGMSGKAAAAQDYAPQQWETWAINEARKYTDRPIIYRPKPNWKGASPIAGAEYQVGHPQGNDVQAQLNDTWCVLTHHSNVGVDALLAGVPVISIEGIASVLSTKIDKIDAPHYPEGRERFAADAAYCQWTVSEMTTGICWRHLKEEGLLL